MHASRRPRPVALAGTILITVAALLGACSSTTTTSTTASTSAGTIASTTTPPGTAKTSGTIVPGPVEMKVITTPFGTALGRGDGRVLYAWDQETGPDAKCTDAACTEKWPPFVATSFSVGAGVDKSMFTLVDRPDGTKQVAVQGKRLYRMSADEPGEANCQGGEGWFIRNPDGTSLKNTTSTAAPKK